MIADLVERLRALLVPGRRAAELEDELRLHVELEAADRIRAGASAGEAYRQARLALGGAEKYKEEVRDASGVRPLQDLGADVRYAVRGLRHNAGFALTVVVVLGLAIGATTAVFSVVDRVLWGELPYDDPDRLVQVFEQNSPTNRWNISVADYQGIMARQHSFSAFGGVWTTQVGMSGIDAPEQARIGVVTAGFFDALGVRAAAGRVVQPSDEQLGAPRVAVIGRALADRLGGVTAALGHSVTLDGTAYTIVGVLPADRTDLAGFRASAWIAYQMQPPTRRGPFPMRGVARLKPGVTIEDAARDLSDVSAALMQQWTSDFHDTSAKLTPHDLRETIVGRVRGQLDLFAAAVVLVLLVAIANVATLALVRASARQPEFAMRAALGGSRLRLARLLLTEHAVLSGLAAMVGLALAWIGLNFVGGIAPTLPRAPEIGLDARAVLLALGIAALAACITSAAPLAQLVRGWSRARAENRRTGGERRGEAVRAMLVGAEFALALPLLLGAGLLLNSFLRLQRVDPGYDWQSTLDLGITLPKARYDSLPDMLAFFDRAELAAAQTPGVVAAGFSTAAPPDNPGDMDNFELLDHPVTAGQPEHVVPWSYVTSGFFQAMRIPLLEGRLFNAGDSATAPNNVVIVSRAWAARYFPGENAIGRTLWQGGCRPPACQPTVIVGIVGDVKYQGLAGDGIAVYGVLAQSGWRSANLVARTRGDPVTMIEPLVRGIRAIDPDQPLPAATGRERMARSLGDPERWTKLLLAFAASALGLATLGVFGLMSYVVRRQRREIGVRLALGARPADVTRMIVRRGLVNAAVGTAAGAVIAVLGMKWLRAMLYDVTPGDPLTIAAATGVLLLAALLASLVPGLRAARIRPIEAIATE